MGVLQFDGVDDRLKWTTLASALLNVSDGAWTLAVLLKRGGVASATAYDGVSYLLSGTGNGTAKAGFSFHGVGSGDDNKIFVDVGSGSRTLIATFTNTTSPYLIVLSKGAGTVVPRAAWKVGSGGAWTHQNLNTTVADQIDATMIEIGAWQAEDFFTGHIGVVAWWEGAMSDADKEALDDNWRTSDWWNSAHGQPVFLAELNVAGASVVDLAGNASSLSVTGTTLDSGETLDSWNFNGKGVVTAANSVPLLLRTRRSH